MTPGLTPGPRASGRGSRVSAILFDAFGTLVTIEDPAAALREELAQRGFEVDAAQAQAAFAAEISYYLEHNLAGRDGPSLDDLRDRCADVLRHALDEPRLDHATARAAMLAAIRFVPFDDAAPALRDLRERRLRLAVASNWDVSLPDALARTGLAEAFDAIVSSAEVGAAKPDPRLLETALARVGCEPHEALYIGDSPTTDVPAARAAGIRPVLVTRGGGSSGGDVPTIERLTELGEMVWVPTPRPTGA